jgi:hypothetical protein
MCKALGLILSPTKQEYLNEITEQVKFMKWKEIIA